VSDDPLDTEMARLLAACRDERPSETVRRRALKQAESAAQRRSGSVGGALLLVAASMILAVGLSTWRSSAPNIGAERLAASAPHHVEAVVTTKPEVVAQPSATAAPTAPTPKPSSKPQPAKVSPLTLEEETQALERARTAIHAGDPGSALSELDAYQKAARGGALALEATLLRIQALAAAGRTGEASELARRFIALNPNSPLVDRARRYLAPSPAGEIDAGDGTDANGRQEQ
jgi:hypothetical protein